MQEGRNIDWDHPRIRGEHPSSYRSAVRRSGSSPHTRGARRSSGGGCACGGIIPAYAGSTWLAQKYGRLVADHPRIRGEHESSTSRSRPSPGSSPHTRGAPDRGSVVGQLVGIIPAYAGSTRRQARHGAARTDHPRIRGEHGPPRSISTSQTGSSPHTRGARINAGQGRSLLRIIPAYAGSTRPIRHHISHFQDHPRIRGEHPGVLASTRLGEGSSPHTRGALPV